MVSGGGVSRRHVHRVPPYPMYIVYPLPYGVIYRSLIQKKKKKRNTWVHCMQLVSSPRQTALGPAATRTLAAQGAGYKNRCSLQQLPKKGHFLKEMHQKNIFAFGEKKSQFFFFAPSARDGFKHPPRGGGGAIEILPRCHVCSGPYT